jgi:hypothetical protein
MNEELQSKLVEVLTSISEGVAQAKDFAVEQLPDVAQQYIMFGMVWETTAFVVLTLLLLPSLRLAGNGLKLLTDKNSDYSDENRGFTFLLLGGIASGVFGFLAMMQLRLMLLVWFAPKLYLLQGIAGLIK